MVVRKVAQRIPFTPSKTQAALLGQCFGARRLARMTRKLTLTPYIQM